MKKGLLLLAIIIILTLLGSCAYYNTFYNAKELFESASSKELESTGRASRAAQQQYNDVIKKCTSLLEFYPNSDYVDDAIYLMAQSFYKKGGSNTQVLEQCNKLIQYFPDSEFYTDAIILKAQLNRDINKANIAYSLLEEQILNPRSLKEEAKVLLKMADFYTEDKEYEKARFYLNKIIEEHKSTQEFKQASYFIGLNYFDEENYEQAINAFEKFIKIKNGREIKYDARYYIALSNYYLENYSTALKQIKKLYEDEYRKDEKNKISVLKGKILLASGEVEEGLEVLNSLIAGNQRGKYSAETNYVLGDYYLTNTDSLRLAIEHFNNVKKADSNSEFVESSVAKSSVASQIRLFRDDNSTLEPSQLVSEQFKLAEYYLDIMQLPDSALVVYDDIIANKAKFLLLQDTLSIKLDSLQLAINKLTSQTNTMLMDIDSLRTLVLNTNTLADTLTADSLKTEDPNGDKMLILESQLDTLNTQLDELRRDSLTVSTRSKNISDVLVSFDEEYIPFASFIKAYIYIEILKDASSANDVLVFLQENYPDSKYTYTIENYLKNGSLKMTTKRKELSLKMYEEAAQFILENPDTTIVMLESILDSLDTDELIKAKLALGYLNYTKEDTTKAREYFLDLAENYELSEKQSAWLTIFFSNNKINKLESLEFDTDEIEEINDETSDIDSLQTNSPKEEIEEVLDKDEDIEEEIIDKNDKIETPFGNTPPPTIPGNIEK